MTKKGLAPALAIAAALNVGQAEALSPNVEDLREGVRTELIGAMTELQLKAVQEEVARDQSVGFFQKLPYIEPEPKEPVIIMADTSGMTGTMTDAKTGETATIKCDLNGDGKVKGFKEKECELDVRGEEADAGAVEARQGAAEARKRGEALEAESRMVQKKIDRTIDEILKKTGG